MRFKRNNYKDIINMKYIKTFEAKRRERSYHYNSKPEESEVEGLQEFCSTYLAYLTDEGFDIKVLDDRMDKKISISLLKGSKYTGFQWSEIENYFIPFLIHLSKEYSICFDSIYIIPLINGHPATLISYYIDDIVDEIEEFDNLIDKWGIKTTSRVLISEIKIGVEYKINLD